MRLSKTVTSDLGIHTETVCVDHVHCLLVFNEIFTAVVVPGLVTVPKIVGREVDERVVRRDVLAVGQLVVQVGVDLHLERAIRPVQRPAQYSEVVKVLSKHVLPPTARSGGDEVIEEGEVQLDVVVSLKVIVILLLCKLLPFPSKDFHFLFSSCLFSFFCC